MPNGFWIHDLTLLLELIRGGGASWARAHWLEGVEKLEHGTSGWEEGKEVVICTNVVLWPYYNRCNVLSIAWN